MEPQNHRPPPLDGYWSFASVTDGGSDRCRLVTDGFGRAVQLILVAAAIFILAIKRKLEFPVRPLQVWALDVSKQGIGAIFVHIMTIVISVVFVGHADKHDDECGVYFVAYMLDSTWGVGLVLVLLHVFHYVADRLELQDVTDSGYYGDPPRWSVWGKQLGVYLLALVVMKLVNSWIVWVCYTSVAGLGNEIFASFINYRHLELMLVMVIWPGCFNAFQFWIVDSALKSNGEHWKYYAQCATKDEVSHFIDPSTPAGDSPAVIVRDPTLVPIVKSSYYHDSSDVKSTY